MDIILKLRIVFWILVLALWGVVTYQFLGKDIGELTRMYYIQNPFARQLAPRRRHRVLPKNRLTFPKASQVPPAPRAASAPAAVERHFVKPIPVASLPPPSPREVSPAQPQERAPPRERVEVPQVPSGFFRTETPHFYVFTEGAPADKKFLDTLENLHANVMLDLASFSPWARDERVSVFIFTSQESYRRTTGRPAWSGGASSVSRRKIYLYRSEELIGILAHELCHIYFDSFFLTGRADPLWLSEGMATLTQIERGLASPNWLAGNLDILYRGGGFSLANLFSVDSTSGAGDDDVRLWYTQSYSVVRFMVRAQWRSSFYHFCINLRDGLPVGTALYRAYGMPFNRVQALEYAWRYDLRTHRITNINPARR